MFLPFGRWPWCGMAWGEQFHWAGRLTSALFNVQLSQLTNWYTQQTWHLSNRLKVIRLTVYLCPKNMRSIQHTDRSRHTRTAQQLHSTLQVPTHLPYVNKNMDCQQLEDRHEYLCFITPIALKAGRHSCPPGDLISHLSCIGAEILADGEQSYRTIGESPPHPLWLPLPWLPLGHTDASLPVPPSLTAPWCWDRRKEKEWWRHCNKDKMHPFPVLLLPHSAIHNDLAFGPHHKVLEEMGDKSLSPYSVRGRRLAPTAVQGLTSVSHHSLFSLLPGTKDTLWSRIWIYVEH